MRALIVEDEKLTAERLEGLIKKEFPDLEVCGMAHSVQSANKWLDEQEHPDLVFMDIELGDGTAFDVIESRDLSIPIIFTTAYDAYAIKAFKFNSIDYLLKPVDLKELRIAVEKWRNSLEKDEQPKWEELKRYFEGNYKKRFLVKSGDKFITVSVDQVVYFYSEHSYSFLVDKEGKKWILDYTLDDLNEILDPGAFFRLNRKLICHIDAISAVSSYFNGRLVVKLEPEFSEQIVISRERVKPFKSWLDG